MNFSKKYILVIGSIVVMTGCGDKEDMQDIKKLDVLGVQSSQSIDKPAVKQKVPIETKKEDSP